MWTLHGAGTVDVLRYGFSTERRPWFETSWVIVIKIWGESVPRFTVLLHWPESRTIRSFPHSETCPTVIIEEKLLPRSHPRTYVQTQSSRLIYRSKGRHRRQVTSHARRMARAYNFTVATRCIEHDAIFTADIYGRIMQRRLKLKSETLECFALSLVIGATY